MTVAAPRAEPGYFGPPTRPRLGWLHRPAPSAPQRDAGLVLCNPFGYEAMCAHRSLRHLAEGVAEAGFPALRFDYDGSGDSAGEDLDPGRWEAWLQSIRDAAAELTRQAGVARICLLGVRFGGTLASYAASEIPNAAGLILIAPVASGKPWLRELRAVQAAMGRAAAPPEFALPQQVHESAGLLLDADSRLAIELADLATLRPPSPGAVLLIDRSDRPPLNALAETWRGSGRSVTHEVLPGFVEMMSDPHESVVPSGIVASVMAWMGATFPASDAARVPQPTGTRRTQAAVGADVMEETHFVDGDQRLFGVLSLPRASEPKRALLLLNAGSNHHIGNGRLYVKLARRFAAAGWAVLRYDVSGIGESLPHEGAPENEVYTANATADLGAAIAFLHARFTLERTEVVGLCSGAYHGFKGAVAGLPITGLTVTNPLVFFWKAGMSLSYPPFQAVVDAAQYRKSMRDPMKWLRVLRGQVDVRGAVRAMSDRVLEQSHHAARDLARAAGLRVKDDLAAELSTVTGRGVALRFVFSVGDPGEVLLRSDAGRRLGQLEAAGKVQLQYLVDCDHSLSSSWMQEVYWRLLHDTLAPAGAA